MSGWGCQGEGVGLGASGFRSVELGPSGRGRRGWERRVEERRGWGCPVGAVGAKRP